MDVKFSTNITEYIQKCIFNINELFLTYSSLQFTFWKILFSYISSNLYNETTFHSYKPIQTVKLNKRKSIMTNPIKKLHFCKIFPVYCIDNNDNKIIGYSLYIKYLKLKFKFGPFKNYQFVSDLKSIVRYDIEHLQCTRQNYLNTIPEYVNMKQKELSNNHQVLEIYSKGRKT